jgi:hypothetical protein
MNPYVEIEKVLAQLEGYVGSIADLAMEAANAEAIYKTESAKTRLLIRATGEKKTVAEVEDIAQAQCEKQHLEYLITAAHLSAAREALRATQARLDGLRTLAAGTRNLTS